MVCPYCNRRVKDIPDHLEVTPVCRQRHLERLKAQFLQVVKVNLEKKEP